MSADLRDVAIEAAKAALLAEQWEPGRPWSAHGNHVYSGCCAICCKEVDRIIPVALDAADAALALGANSGPKVIACPSCGTDRWQGPGPCAGCGHRPVPS